ncbi:hypothetical protein [Paracoccus sp. Ld10]|uniref:hypothetical protein n=1 Tax=Paracoccus sp. Ld10 TaxID=649158 RepID=UPI00386C25B4
MHWFQLTMRIASSPDTAMIALHANGPYLVTAPDCARLSFCGAVWGGKVRSGDAGLADLILCGRRDDAIRHRI